MKRYGQGWYGESHRHYLASKGIMSSGGDLLEKSNMLGRVFDLKDTFDKGEAIVPSVAHSGEQVLPRAFKAGEDDRVLPSSFRKGGDVTGGAHHAAIEYADKKKKSEGLSDDDVQYMEEQREAAGKQIDARWKENEEEEGKYFASKDMVSFSPQEAAAFKKRFEEAQANGEEQFTWEGRPVFTSYAKYMVEYMKMRGYNAKKDPMAKYYARTIGPGNVEKVKRLVDEAESKGIVSIPEVQDYVKGGLGDKVLDSWEGADMEVNRVVADEVMNPFRKKHSYDSMKEAHRDLEVAAAELKRNNVKDAQHWTAVASDKLGMTNKKEYDAKMEQWPKYKHVPGVKTPKQVFDFEEKTGRRHDGEPLGHYLNREATIEYDAKKGKWVALSHGLHKGKEGYIVLNAKTGKTKFSELKEKKFKK